MFFLEAKIIEYMSNRIILLNIVFFSKKPECFLIMDHNLSSKIMNLHSSNHYELFINTLISNVKL